uniref:Uncharacterized protein n=1 Tax=Chaetoceros debilis TaxID=122233 RepID=A0A7S3QCV6_9STRA
MNNLEIKDGWGDDDSVSVSVSVGDDMDGDGWGDDTLDMLDDDDDDEDDGGTDDDGDGDGGDCALAALNGNDDDDVFPGIHSSGNGRKEEDDNDEDLAALNNDSGWDWENNDNSNSSSSLELLVDDHEIESGNINLNQAVRGASPRGPAPVQQQVQSQSQSQSQVDPLREKVVRGLMEYIQDLGSNGDTNADANANENENILLQSLNEQLERQCNHTEAALEICRYYHDRPKLKEYTLDAEITRMEYQILISDDIVLTNADEIKHYFSQQSHGRENGNGNGHEMDLVDDMLLRCANQSILADIFPIITGPRKIVRMQFLANAVATRCRFVLDMRKDDDVHGHGHRHGHGNSQRRRSLQVDCSLTVSIPCESSDNGTSTSTSKSSKSKLDLATLRLMIDFSPEPAGPSLQYQLVSIQPLLDLSPPTASAEYRRNMTLIRAAADMIDPYQMDAVIMEAQEQEQGYDYDNTGNEFVILRDTFIESMITTQAASAGFKSALRDIDNVVNVSSKFNYLKQVSAAAATILPSADDIMKVAESVEQEHEHQYEHQHVHGASSIVGGIDAVGIGASIPPHSAPIVTRQQLKSLSHAHGHDHTNPPMPPSHSQAHAQVSRPETSVNANASSTSRPKPIIGGLLISSISRLAKAATQPQQEEGHTTLYRRDENKNNDDNGKSSRVTATSKRAIPAPPLLPPKSMGTGSASRIRAHTPPPPPPPERHTRNAMVNERSSGNDLHDSDLSGLHDDDDDDDDNDISGGGWSDDDDLDSDLEFDDQSVFDSANNDIGANDEHANGLNHTSSYQNAPLAGRSEGPHIANGNAEQIQGGNLNFQGLPPNQIPLPLIPRKEDESKTTPPPPPPISIQQRQQPMVPGIGADDDFANLGSKPPHYNAVPDEKLAKFKLEEEREYLLQKIEEIKQTRPLDDDLVGDETNAGVIPTRKRFVSRSQMLGFNTLSNIRQSAMS